MTTPNLLNISTITPQSLIYALSDHTANQYGGFWMITNSSGSNQVYKLNSVIAYTGTTGSTYQCVLDVVRFDSSGNPKYFPLYTGSIVTSATLYSNQNTGTVYLMEGDVLSVNIITLPGYQVQTNSIILTSYEILG
jgi:hypothetical protein